MRGLLARWFGARDALPLRTARWVVVDCETSGLDAARDRLLSIGAVAVRAGRIELAEAFSALLRQDAPSDPANMDASSVRISPNMFSVTMTSKLRGSRSSCIAHASTSI